ncbi:hypothetical protein C2845_PM17G06670 [Panicum miliaceum]|uniref:Uncharacterized protein n=1 Tax=Panicum miliaceum TaxID=4540 RepID=A0A3L6Q3G1_PANMI|nr:hypothetical protein C2845_PM17G06670 [Panicum miliaceum]
MDVNPLGAACTKDSAEAPGEAHGENSAEAPEKATEEESGEASEEHSEPQALWSCEQKCQHGLKIFPNSKVELEITMSEGSDLIKVLGEIKELCILRLCVKPHHDADGKVDLCVWANGIHQRCYFNVKILEIACSSKLNVSFGSEAMQNLELLTARCCSGLTLKFAEIKNLSKLKLKEVRLLGSYDDKLKEDLDNQLN